MLHLRSPRLALAALKMLLVCLVLYAISKLTGQMHKEQLRIILIFKLCTTPQLLGTFSGIPPWSMGCLVASRWKTLSRQVMRISRLWMWMMRLSMRMTLYDSAVYD